MRHRKSRLRLNRFTSWRKATLISLAKNLLIHQSIKTTKIKAQAVKPLVDKLISLAKLNTLTAKRQAYKILGNHRQVSLLFNDIAPRFNNRVGGYTRLLNLCPRRGDNAELVILELSEIKKKEKKIPKKEIKAEIKLEEKKEKKLSAKLEVKKSLITKKPFKRFLGGIRDIFKFKKERDSL